MPGVHGWTPLPFLAAAYQAKDFDSVCCSYEELGYCTIPNCTSCVDENFGPSFRYSDAELEENGGSEGESERYH